MFRAAVSNVSWSLTSLPPRLPRSSPFHTAATLHVAKTGTSVKKHNIEETEKRRALEDANRPSVVLGTRPQEEATIWPKCDLAKCLVNASNLNGPPASPFSSSSTLALAETIEINGLGTSVTVPKNRNYGIGLAEKKMLFGDLPTITVEAPLETRNSNFDGTYSESQTFDNPEQLATEHAKAVEVEQQKMEALAKVIDLHNANAGGISYENRQRIILAFSSPENPFDPGRTEVQAALLTYKIRNMWQHLTSFKRDVGNRRALLKLIHQRAKILRYLKRKDQDRYESLLPRLALAPESVEGELNL
ncbi:hypothetical protein NP233_g11466 [Leucocoprinus birnbaumii]|uniref:Ribosomal protein S15 n=1 Tax=Leucocoprinus birnbaumii TaxID=56174 RepID=A0AAD5VGI5_9AGAR|nr:hypothetical protein NP233_g11466 [Leucocoprinus birnbaumii]